MNILGLSAFFHDAAACVLRNGEIVAAAQEERFTRVKQDASLPVNAIRYCLAQAGLSMDEIDYVGFYEKPYLKFERLLSIYGATFPRGWETFKIAAPTWLAEKLRLPAWLSQELLELSPTKGAGARWDGRVIFAEHHHSHAASAFYASPFDRAAILVLDGVGEWATTTLAVTGTDARNVPVIRALKEIRYPHSLGMLYSAFTAFLGFKVNSAEYKVMGLAPYGVPRFVDLILQHLVSLGNDGAFSLNMKYFTFDHKARMFNDAFCELFGVPQRDPEGLIDQTHLDIAASLQVVTERLVLAIADHLHDLTGEDSLCMAGGVALNCVANGYLQKHGRFKDIWIQPASGDAGGALGVAYYIWHEVLGNRKVQRANRRTDMMQGALLGPAFSSDEIRSALQRWNLPYEELSSDAVAPSAAQWLSEQRTIGWFQGRMEFGPRALGARSILADPRSPSMQRDLNIKIKFRESFRPFAPAVLREKVQEWFDLEGRLDSTLGSPGCGYDSPYMLLVAPVQARHQIRMTVEQSALFGIDKLNIPRSKLPACTHVDYSARIQTVDDCANPRFAELLRAFERLTGVPVLLNTSFNVRGEPIVCSPDDAIRCFLGTNIDILIMENCVVHRSQVPAASLEALRNYHQSFELD